jgi:hypothetical protein
VEGWPTVDAQPDRGSRGISKAILLRLSSFASRYFQALLFFFFPFSLGLNDSVRLRERNLRVVVK